MQLLVRRLTDTAKLPTYAHPGDAGLDIFADESVVILAQQRAVVHTGIAVEIPEGCVGLVWDKSGIAVTAGLITLAGVIDAGYRGEVQIALYNTSDQIYHIKAGQKIAQLLVQPVAHVDVSPQAVLADSTRGVRGFGSTGL